MPSSLPITAERPLTWKDGFRQRSVWRRAATLGLSVGFLQAAINQGDHWLRGAVDGPVLVKSIVSPLVGFALVLFSAAQTWVEKSHLINKTQSPQTSSEL